LEIAIEALFNVGLLHCSLVEWKADPQGLFHFVYHLSKLIKDQRLKLIQIPSNSGERIVVDAKVAEKVVGGCDIDL
jgi:hypothetical protein